MESPSFSSQEVCLHTKVPTLNKILILKVPLDSSFFLSLAVRAYMHQPKRREGSWESSSLCPDCPVPLVAETNNYTLRSRKHVIEEVLSWDAAVAWEKEAGHSLLLAGQFQAEP